MNKVKSCFNSGFVNIKLELFYYRDTESRYLWIMFSCKSKVRHLKGLAQRKKPICGIYAFLK